MWGGREGKSHVETSGMMEMEWKHVKCQSMVSRGGGLSLRVCVSGHPECFEKYVVCVAHRKTGSVLESRVKRSRRPIRYVVAISV